MLAAGKPGSHITAVLAYTGQFGGVVDAVNQDFQNYLVNDRHADARKAANIWLTLQKSGCGASKLNRKCMGDPIPMHNLLDGSHEFVRHLGYGKVLIKARQGVLSHLQAFGI